MARALLSSRSMDKARFGRALVIALFSLISLKAFAETRTATTTIGITVERHAAILLAGGDELARARAARGSERESFSAVGNASPAVIVTHDARPMTAVSTSPTRVAVTVFEP